MATFNRADQINKVFKVLRKHYKPVPPSVDRSVLEHLLYACCLENTFDQKADEAFARTQSLSYDWNEVRVTAVSELAESMAGCADPKRAASNLRKALHSVFESQYSYDLEHLKKQNLGKTIKELAKFQGTNGFVVAYVTQHALAGHAIPLDRGALDVMFIAGVIDTKERERDAVPGLERAVPKKKGLEFGSLLHQLAADLVAGPFSPQVRAILLEMNPDGKERLPKRQSRKTAKKPAATSSPPAKKKTDKPTKTPAADSKTSAPASKKPAAASKKTTATPKKPTARPQKPAATPKKPAVTPPKKKNSSIAKPTEPEKKRPVKKVKQKGETSSTKRSPTKQLAKRKPR